MRRLERLSTAKSVWALDRPPRRFDLPSLIAQGFAVLGKPTLRDHSGSLGHFEWLRVRLEKNAAPLQAKQACSSGFAKGFDFAFDTAYQSIEALAIRPSLMETCQFQH